VLDGEAEWTIAQDSRQFPHDEVVARRIVVHQRRRLAEGSGLFKQAGKGI
jgi:hypothetical protein